MLRIILKVLHSNFYLFLGILIGVYISTIFIETTGPSCKKIDSIPLVETNSSSTGSPLKINTPKKSSSPPNKSKLVRPRYFSTELGIREKLFVGIFSSEENVNTLAIPLNKTINQLVDLTKFFITAQYKLKTRFNLSGLVGFTDTRAKYRPFQVLKYIGDNFLQDYDYYFLTNDYTFINVHRLKDLVKKISVSMDVYLGETIKDGSFCNIDSGILLSNSVVKAVRDHLDWCVINAISEDNSENIGRCIHHSLGLSCQDTLQGQTFHSFKLKHFELTPHLLELTKNQHFNKAVTIHPILKGDNFYQLNAYFLRQRLLDVKKEINSLSEELTDVWPPGQREGAKPATRFDLPKHFYFNMTHMFFPDDFTNIRLHTEADQLDIENVIEEVKIKFYATKPRKYEYRRLINGYRSFDLSRGMDYILDVGFRDLTTGKEDIKRFEVCKPLGKVEFIPIPYVTETSRVTIILPIEEHLVDPALQFLRSYVTNIMDRKEKTFLMLGLIYQMDSSNKGSEDVYFKIKNFATLATNKYKNDDIKIAWVSIRLPASKTSIKLVDYPALEFGIVDLALRKVGVDNIILTLNVYANISSEFLNRVRMNTIPNTQIFSPIPYRQYNPKITQAQSFEVNKNGGHFDKEEYRIVSFYGKDYVIVRKKHQQRLPVFRADKDIEEILTEFYKGFSESIFQMFVEFGDNLHCMRATEAALKIIYHEETRDRGNLFLGSAAQLGRLLINYKAQIPELAKVL